MKYQMPSPAIDHLSDGETTCYYTATQVQAAFSAGRAEGLEAAANVCENHRSKWVSIEAAGELGDAIRNLAKETPCA